MTSERRVGRRCGGLGFFGSEWTFSSRPSMSGCGSEAEAHTARPGAFRSSSVRSNLVVVITSFLMTSVLQTPAMPADDAFQQMINYVFTGQIAPGDAPEIVDRKLCSVLVHETKFNRYARYYLSRFKMDTSRISKTYVGTQVHFELEVEGDDVILEYLKADKRTVDYGFKSAHISLPGNIEQTEKALRLIFAEHCKSENPKPPF